MTAHEPPEREVERLRRENRLLRVENEMLRRIATEYALERRDGLISPGSA
ncbi:hypothetical protein [Parasphingorhabdus pacifica]